MHLMVLILQSLMGGSPECLCPLIGCDRHPTPTPPGQNALRHQGTLRIHIEQAGHRTVPPQASPVNSYLT